MRNPRDPISRRFPSVNFFFLFSDIFFSVVFCQNDINPTLSGSFFTDNSLLLASVVSTAVPPPNLASTDNGASIRQTFTAQIPIHMLPSNQIVDYFPWEVDTGLDTCPYTGMLVRAHRGLSSPLATSDEKLDDLRNYPSPHCSVECECIATGDYRCKSICAPPPDDMDFCVPVPVPGQCCHKYICDDDLDAAFPKLQYPEPQNASVTGSSSTTLLCEPGSILPDSVCHAFFPKAFSGHLGPKGICFDYDDIRCAWLDDNEISAPDNSAAKGNGMMVQNGRKDARQTIFFQTARNGTVFSTNVPLKKFRSRLRSQTT